MMNKKKRSKSENDILRFAEMHGEWTAIGIVQCLAARRLALEGAITIVKDEADEYGIGQIRVKHNA